MASPPGQPLHLLGIGPWNSNIPWRAAPNRGLPKGSAYASAPLMRLPPAGGAGFTLRLGAPAEATTSHTFNRGDAIVIEENLTDLWWRRRDPNRNTIDRIGRFNANTVDVSSNGGGGLSVDVSYVDYQALLEDRLVLQYKNTAVTPHTIQFDKGDLVVDVLRWLVPTNSLLDLTGIQTATADIDAKLANPVAFALGAPLKEAFDTVLANSDKTWEWWVDMPASDTARPRLTLAAVRGTDRGITLFDTRHGPILSWSLQRDAERYANKVYFIGETGGVVVAYEDQVAIYGQREVSFSDSTVKAATVGGVPTKLNAAANKKLAEVAALTPSYQVQLRRGFWEGRNHIDVGDWVSLRLELGADDVSGKYRVTEIAVSLDADGTESVTLTVGTPRPSRDPRSRQSSTARIVRYLKNYVAPETA